MNTAGTGVAPVTLLVSGILLLLFSAAFAEDAPAPAGVLWENTSQVTMEGMPFSPPAQTYKRCTPVEWTEPPGAGDDERGCVSSGFERFENTVLWNSTCSGPPEMAGRGEIVFEDETTQAYTGKIQYSTDEGSVVINLSGKAVGSCDVPR